MQNKPTIAVIGGTGDLGSGLARLWATAGYSVVLGSRAKDKAEAAALYREALDLIPERDTDRRRDISKRRTLALVAVSHIVDARNLQPGAEG